MSVATDAEERSRPPQARREWMVALALLGVGSVVAAMGEDVRTYVLPSAAIGVGFLAFWALLARRTGANPLGELGFVYLGLIVVYTVLPAFALTVAAANPNQPLGALLPEPPELARQLWRQVLFAACVAVGYLAARGRKELPAGTLTSTLASSRAILAIFALVGAWWIVSFAVSAPVTSYYEHYTRYDHLGWLSKKLVSVGIRLSLGLYCVVLTLMFRDYARWRRLIPVTLVAIISYEVLYSFGARIQAMIVILQALVLYHLAVRRIPLRWAVIAGVAVTAVFTAVEVVRLQAVDFGSAREALSESGGQPASEFLSVFFSAFHLYGERAAGAIPPREWPMFFVDFTSLVSFGDFQRWNPMTWYAANYFPDADVAPVTLGPIADSAIWGGEWDLVARGLLNGVFFAAIVNWYRARADRWWALAVYAYAYATAVLTLKYSVFYVLNPLVKTVLPSLLVAWALRRNLGDEARPKGA